MGLSVNGQHVFCGDYIYSGHTMIIIMGHLIIRECKENHTMLDLLSSMSSSLQTPQSASSPSTG